MPSRDEGPGPLIVQGIEPGGRVDRDGRLAVGDEIVEINGVPARRRRLRQGAGDLQGGALRQGAQAAGGQGRGRRGGRQRRGRRGHDRPGKQGEPGPQRHRGVALPAGAAAAAARALPGGGLQGDCSGAGQQHAQDRPSHPHLAAEGRERAGLQHHDAGQCAGRAAHARLHQERDAQRRRGGGGHAEAGRPAAGGGRPVRGRHDAVGGGGAAEKRRTKLEA